MALISLPRKFSIRFLEYPLLPFILFFSTMALTFVGYYTKGVHWGVDFSGGLMIEAQLPRSIPLQSLRKRLKPLFPKEISLQSLGKEDTLVLIRTSQQTPLEQETLLSSLKESLGKEVVYRKVSSIGPKVGLQLIKNGLYAIFCAFIGMMVFLWIRFEWQFCLCAVAALIHDCLAMLAFFILFRMEINEGIVVAMLITAAYSINDTVVIFDRLREKNKTNPDLSKKELLNSSLNETFSRTLLTSSTTLLALGSLYLWGGEVIAAFSLPIIIGIVIGTYSSVAIAVPLLLWLPWKQSPKKDIPSVANDM